MGDSTKTMGYWSDLTSVGLSDDTNRQWVHALPVGEYEHPLYGKLSFTADRIERFAASVKNKIRGIDPDIDYDHKMDPAKGKVAAGWVKDADTRSDGLWLLVEWTKDAAKAINDRLYRYFSAEFLDTWEDAQGKKHEDVLLGGGITNRPFMKDLVPINLSELVGERSTIDQEDKMDRKELAKLLGLPEDATEEQIKAKLEESKGADLDLSKAEITVGDDGTLKVTHPDIKGEVTHKLEVPQKSEEGTTEAEAELAKLAESNPALAKVLSEQKTMRDELASMAAAQRLSEVGTQLSEIGKENHQVLPPVTVDKLKEVMVQLPKALSDKVAEAMQDLAKVGLVKLGETKGNDPARLDDADNPVKQFVDEVDKVRKDDDELSYKNAVNKVKAEQPRLFAEYQAAVERGTTLAG
jgi:phage I-like protein